MSESHHVKFRTGRDPYDSEARSSVGLGEHREETGEVAQCTRHTRRASRNRHSQHPEHLRSTASLRREVQSITTGIQASDDALQFQDFLAETDRVLVPLAENYSSSDIMREDVDSLRSVLEERYLKLLKGAPYRTRSLLKKLLRSLRRVTARRAEQDSVKIMRRAQSGPEVR
jgi:hypothetical protein